MKSFPFCFTILGILVLFLLPIGSYAQETEIVPVPSSQEKNASGIVERPDVYPQFPCRQVPMMRDGVEFGKKMLCGKPAFDLFVQENLQYPEEAKEKRESGTVYLKIVVNKKGKITEIEVLRGVSPSLNAEAIRLIKSMPKWVPALNEGETVAASLVLPIVFVL